MLSERKFSLSVFAKTTQYVTLCSRRQQRAPEMTLFFGRITVFVSASHEISMQGINAFASEFLYNGSNASSVRRCEIWYVLEVRVGAKNQIRKQLERDRQTTEDYRLPYNHGMP